MMCLVAVYFWAPLVAGWVSDDEAGAAKAKAAQKAALAKTKSVTTAKSSTEERDNLRGFEWRKLNEWIDAEPLMTTASLANLERDPFTALEVKKEPEKKDVEVANVDKPQTQHVDPNDIGLVLRSTFVTPHLRKATVNDITYQEKGVIKVKFGSTGASDTFEYVIEKVASGYILLSRNDRRYQVKLAAVNLTSGSLTFGNRKKGI